jgi:carbamoyl-phosphate synthase small subunit
VSLALPKREKALLVLADGSTFEGYGFGELRGTTNPACGEVVFNTSMLGYQEILTDPSYAGQIMTFTNPHIGNVGCNSQDVESYKMQAEGVIIRELSKVSSNFRSQESFSKYLEQEGKMGIYGIDTRALVRKLRDKGSQMGVIACAGLDKAKELQDYASSRKYEDVDYVAQVSCQEPYTWMELPWSAKSNSYPKLSESTLKGRPHVVAIDCGIKFNILRLLTGVGFRVTVVPCWYTPEQILALKPSGVFMSNGPGDPGKLTGLVSTTKSLLGKVPMFGICLGHQLMGQALGGKTFKLGFGHRGGNHPVRNDLTSVIEISVQNHGYAVDPMSLPRDAGISHINLNDRTVEGLDLPKLKAFSVQYHPESSPGPHDAEYLFKRFYDLVTHASA